MFFDRFTDTIMAKSSSDLEKQIEILNKLKEKYPNNEEILSDLKFCTLGLQGEKEIEYELKRSNIGMYVMHDICLKINDLTAQIDYLVVTPGYTYIIECKNLIGNITVNERGDFIREYMYGNKKTREGFSSPIRQAQMHKDVLMKIKDRNQNLFKKIVIGDKFHQWYKPLVVMANSKNIINTKYAPKEIKNAIVRSDALVDYIKKDIEYVRKHNDGILSTQKTMLQVTQNLLKEHVNLNKDYTSKYKNLEEIPTENTTELKEKLIQYRSEKSVKRNIPQHYIFSNEELERILAELPKTKEQLEKLKILSDIKLKLHGQEIVDIINELKK